MRLGRHAGVETIAAGIAVLLLANPNNLVLTRSAATKYFGSLSN